MLDLFVLLSFGCFRDELRDLNVASFETFEFFSICWIQERFLAAFGWLMELDCRLFVNFNIFLDIFFGIVDLTGVIEVFWGSFKGFYVARRAIGSEFV